MGINLEVWELDGLEPALTKKIQQHNKSVVKHVSKESDLLQIRDKLNAEIAGSTESAKPNRTTAVILAEWNLNRVERLDLFRTRRLLIASRLQLLEELTEAYAEQIAKMQSAIDTAIEKAKKQLTKAGSGIETIPAGGGGRMVDIDRKAAEIQFLHRARQNTQVSELLVQHRDLVGVASTFRDHHKLTFEENESNEKTLGQHWQSLAGIFRSHSA